MSSEVFGSFLSYQHQNASILCVFLLSYGLWWLELFDPINCDWNFYQSLSKSLRLIFSFMVFFPLLLHIINHGYTLHKYTYFIDLIVHSIWIQSPNDDGWVAIDRIARKMGKNTFETTTAGINGTKYTFWSRKLKLRQMLTTFSHSVFRSTLYIFHKMNNRLW